MAHDPRNQRQFDEDVAAAAAAGDGSSFANIDGGEMPSVEEVLRMIENMEGLTPEDRANLRASLLNPLGQEAQELLKTDTNSSWDYVIFITMITILICVFALFGYKLYKSLMEKELKKQEKLKLKQNKKAKKAN